MLYYPLRREIELSEARKIYEEKYNGNRKVETVKSQVMEYLEGVQEARYHLEQLENEIDFSEIAEELDPQGEQEKDCDDQETEALEYDHLNPDDLLLRSEAKSASGLYKTSEKRLKVAI